VTLDADYRVIPDLATRWDISADGLSYTFYLAKNVKWHDGQPFTSADVKWTMETIAREKGIAQDVANRVTAIETPDTTTVILRLKEPLASFVPSLAWYGTFILPKHVYEGSDWSKNPANEKPVGTGAFKFVEWVKGDHVTAVANKDYFKRGPFLDQVIWRFQTSSALAPDLIVKGDVDYSVVTPPRERVAELQKALGVMIKTFASTNRYYLAFNLRRKPLDDVRVRKAINMAVDRSAILSRAFVGLGTPGIGFYTPGIPWAYNPNAQAPAYDFAGAEKLLDEAGVKRATDGIRFKSVLIAQSVSPFKDVAQIVQEQLRAVGIAVDLTLPAPADVEKRVYQQKDFDLWVNNGSHGPDPENLYLRFGSTGSFAPTGYASAEFDAAMADGGRQTKVEDRAKAYFRAQEILARDLPLAPLVDHAYILLARANVTGLGYIEARGLVTFQDYSLVRVKR
jgi:peptide/nickel transport system substrate-binding protein